MSDPKEQPDDKLGGRVATSMAWTALGGGFGKVAFAVAGLLTLKFMSLEDLGQAESVFSTFAVLAGISELGLGVALVQRKDASDEQLQGLHWLSILLGALTAVLAAAASPAFAWFYNDGSLWPLFATYAPVLLVTAAYTVPRALMVRDLQFGRIVLVENLALTASSGVMLSLAYLGYGPWAVIAGEVTNRGLQLVGYQICRPYWVSPALNLSAVREMLSFGLHATGSRLLYNLYTRADYFVVGRMFDAATLGLYSVAYRLVFEPLKATVSMINQVAYPAFARLQEDKPRLQKYFFVIARGALLLVGTVLVGLTVFSDWGLEAFGYEELLPVVPFVRVFAIIGVLRCVSPLVPQLLNAVGQARLNFRYSLVNAIVMPLMFVVGAYLAGIEGVLYAWVIGYPVVVLVLFNYGRRVLEMSWMSFMARIFAGLTVLTPVFAVALGLRWLLGDVYATYPVAGLTLAVLGVLGALAGLGLWREKEALAAIRKKRRD